MENVVDVRNAVCDADKVKNVLTELRKVRPYEESAIDIFPLIDEKNLMNI